MGKLSKELAMKIHNRFDVEVIDAKSGEIKQKAQAFNVMCDYFFTAGNSSWGWVEDTYKISVGTGTGTPSHTDTSLFNSVISKSTSEYHYDNSYERNGQGIWSRRIKITLETLECVGEQLTEVGIGTNNKLSSHAVLQDMNGNNISINKTNTDIINIYATTYLHFDIDSDVVVTSVWDGAYSGNNPDEFAVQWREIFESGPIYLFNNSEYYSRFNSQQTLATYCVGSGYEDIGALSRTYDKTNRTLNFKWRVNQNKMNLNGLTGIVLMDGSDQEYATGYGCLMIKPKSTTIPAFRLTSESVGTGDGTTTKFKTKFHCPYNATVYLNGIQASNVTVNKDFCSALTETGINEILYYTNANKLGRPAGTKNYNKVTNHGDNAQERTICNAGYDYGHRIAKVKDNANLSGSNNGSSWTVLSAGTGSGSWVTIAQNYKYYKTTDYRKMTEDYIRVDSSDGYNIIFSTPPAQGDVITIDYTTDYIPKDADHVLDVELTLTFGEWQGE